MYRQLRTIINLVIILVFAYPVGLFAAAAQSAPETAAPAVSSGLYRSVLALPDQMVVENYQVSSWMAESLESMLAGTVQIQAKVSVSNISIQASTPPRFLTLPFPSDSEAYFYDGWWYLNSHSQTPDNPTSADHQGIDYLRSDYSSFPVLAAADGDAKWRLSSTYGNIIEIKHTINQEVWYTIYAHLQDVLIPQDNNSHRVSRGEHIGNAGKTGVWPAGSLYAGQPYSTIHLHFELSKNAPPKAVGYERVDPYGVYGGYDYYPGASSAFTTNPPSYPGTIINPECNAPTNGTPRDNNTLNNNQITFSWTPSSCNALDYYTFRVSNHADIDNPPWIIDHGVSKDSSNITEAIPSQYNGQTLYWAIWPHNSAGYGSKGGPWSFKIDTSTPPTPPPLPTGNWSIQYFRNKELTDQCSTTSFDRTFIFRDWGEGAPTSGCNSDNWGARFTRRVNFQGGNYTFAIEADDWGRIYVDNILFVDKWNGASQHYEGHYVSFGDHDVRVEFADTMGGAKISAWWWGPGFDIPHDTQDPNQWYANYWINPTQWWDAFASRNEGTGILNHDWGDGSPGWDMPSDNFSAKFRRTVYFDCGTYQFVMDHDDGLKFWIDDVLKVDRWTGSIGYYTINLPISRGPHVLQIDQYENGGAAHISFAWQFINGCNPSAPSLQSPSNYSSLAWDTNITLSWISSPGATQYMAQLQGGPGVNINSAWISGTQWEIGDLSPGVYTWSVTARNDYGSSVPSSTWTFTIQDPPPLAPVADFDATPTNGILPLNVTFHNLSEGEVDSCGWDYGDGHVSTSCAEYHDHSYSNPGTYSVSLNVSGPGGSNSLTRSSYIVVSPPQTGDFNKTAPTNGATEVATNPTLNWSTSSGAASYEYCYDTISGNTCDSSWISVGTNTSVTLPNLENGFIYYWQVRARNSAGTTEADFGDWWSFVKPVSCPAIISGWKGEYWDNWTWSGDPLVCRDDEFIDFHWTEGSPHPLIPSEPFSARWTKSILFDAGAYIFNVYHDDGARISVDGTVIYEDPCDPDNCVIYTNFSYTPGAGEHTVVMQMRENGGWAGASLSWSPAENPSPTLSAINPQGKLQGSAGFTLTLDGSNFINGSVAKWGTIDLATTFVNNTQLTAEVPASLLTSAVVVDITVFNPAPGGGTSSAVPFTIYPSLPDLIFADGFESGNVSAWSSSVGGSGDLNVNAAAALIGGKGLELRIDDNAPVYLVENSPAAEAHYRARFYFDPNAIGMVNGNAHTIFYGYRPNGVGLFQVTLYYNNGYQVRVGVVDDAATTWKYNTYTLLSDGPHYLELEWQAATGVGANDGIMKFWVDGVQKGNISGLDTDTCRVESVRLGAITGIDSTTRGSYFIDAFESRRQNIIGEAGVTADFIGSPTSGSAPLTVTFTNLSEPVSKIESYLWDFGDGQYSTEATPTHIYTANSEYTVSLTVAGDGDQKTTTKVGYIHVSDPDLIFKDGFESGDVSAWSSSVGGSGDLTVSGSSALIGSQGLALRINDNSAVYLVDNAPNAEAHYRARFYFDPNAIAMVNGNAHTIFYGYRPNGVGLFQVTLYYNNGYQVRVGVVDDAGTTWKYNSYTLLSDGPHYLELEWQAATGPGANNGTMNFWVDGAQKGNLTTLDTDTCRVESVRLGAITGIDNTTRGSYYIDAFESRRLSSIGMAGVKAEFSASPMSGSAPLAVSFMSLSEPVSKIDTYLWDFGDGGSSTEANPTHIYAANSEYTVSLTVAGDGDVKTATKMGYIKVTEVIFTDGFESGDLSAWSSSVGGSGDLSVNAAAKLVGSNGLQLRIDDNSAVYLVENSPVAEAHYRARFYLDPNSIPMVNGNAHTIFYGYRPNGVGLFQVTLYYNNGYQVRVGVVDDAATTWKYNTYTLLSDGPHYLELEWQAATGVGMNDGIMKFWVDGVPKGNIGGLDTDTCRVESVRLGAITGIDTTTRGSYYFDAFESRRSSYIGP